MSTNISMASSDSDVFYVKQSSNEPSPQRNNSPNILNSTELSEHRTAGMPSISSIASTELHIFTIDDDSNEPTMPYGFGRQLPIFPPSLNDLNLPHNPFNIMATMAAANNTEEALMTTIAHNHLSRHNLPQYRQFCSSDEPRRLYFLPPSPSPPPSPPRKMKTRLSLGKSFPKDGGVSQHICEACGQTIPAVKDIPGPSSRN